VPRTSKASSLAAHEQTGTPFAHFLREAFSNFSMKGVSPMARKYSPKAQKEVEKAMREFERGKLKSGKSGKTVTNPSQAIAIGLSKARKKGAKVPAKPT
jgi:hypothetical protein